MMLCLVPPTKLPTVTTAGNCGSFSRLTSVCKVVTIRLGEHDGINGLVRIGAVAADAAHSEIDAVDVGQRPGRGQRDDAARRIGHVVEGDGVRRVREAREQSVVEHRLGTQADFLGRLQDHHQRAGPFVLHAGKRRRRADPAPACAYRGRRHA